ncbi:hypothetical protein GR212_23690 [Rhizobium lusitanum]|uniref:Ketopantoate reductase N-terminal domain-containing protein n=1 Tax=Rhizobium lusitanum TaxID=293958 RepID=A0A6L9UEL9_9HYPH|nr:hypothetical protein [Rhizobium lusitanum]
MKACALKREMVRQCAHAFQAMNCRLVAERNATRLRKEGRVVICGMSCLHHVNRMRSQPRISRLSKASFLTLLRGAILPSESLKEVGRVQLGQTGQFSSHLMQRMGRRFESHQDQISSLFDVVLLTVKGFALERAIKDFAPAVGPGTIILPVLNGMGHVGVRSPLNLGRSVSRDASARSQRCWTTSDVSNISRSSPASWQEIMRRNCTSSVSPRHPPATLSALIADDRPIL